MIRRYSFSQELAVYGIAVISFLSLLIWVFNSGLSQTNDFLSIIYYSLIYVPPSLFIIGLCVGILNTRRGELKTSNLYGIILNVFMLVLHSIVMFILREYLLIS